MCLIFISNRLAKNNSESDRLVDGWFVGWSQKQKERRKINRKKGERKKASSIRMR